MFEFFKKLFTKPEVAQAKPTSGRRKKTQVSAKDQATAENRPYVNVLSMDVDPANPALGSFELEWNDLFVKQLMLAGYRGNNDEQIVDQWFQNVCRNVVMETWEQEQADPVNRINRRNLGDGRIEVS